MSNTKDPENGFVEWLAALLVELRWSHADLARACGVKQSAIWSLMNREKGIGIPIAKKLAKGLGMSQYDIYRKAGLIDEELPSDEEASIEYKRLLAEIPDFDERQKTIDDIEAILRARVVATKRKATEAKPARGAASTDSKKGRDVAPDRISTPRSSVRD